MHKKWILRDDFSPEADVEGIHPLINKILHKRGLKKSSEIERFFSDDLTDLYNPSLFQDMEKSINRIERAIAAGEKIIVYGDYDVDGITSSALLYNFFKYEMDYEIDYYLPNRLKEGYGLNLEAIKGIIDREYTLLITVDCGITAYREIKYAQKNGLDVIVTDHHQPGNELPPAYAILDPHLEEEKYPYCGLAGVGVAYKLCQGISGMVKNYLDLVALGSVADIVPLRDENRILVKKGMELMESGNNTGLRVLIEKLGLAEKKLSAGQIGYIIAPPLNAAGRLEDPELGIELLTMTDNKQVEEIADKLIKINRQRQQREEEIFEEAKEKVEAQIDVSKDRCIVLASPDWHQGIIGIVASRLVEIYHLPVILMAIEGEKARGSCRSISRINIYQALVATADKLEDFGGHAQAAGLTIKREKIEGFKDSLNRYFNDNYDYQDFIPRLYLDTVLDPEIIDKKLYTEINSLMPFGVGNPRPRFLINNTELSGIYTVGKKDQHLKFKLKNGLQGIGFGFGEIKDKLRNTKVDLACTLSLNEWNGQEELQLQLKDINFRLNFTAYPIEFVHRDWVIYDKRGCRDWYNYIYEIYKGNKKIAVYLNNRKKCNTYLDKLVNDGAGEDVYYNDFSKFNDKNCGLLFYTGLKNTDKLSMDIEIDELVILSLPFSGSGLLEMIELFNPRSIHLLYGQREYYTGKDLIKKRLPTTEMLYDLYNYLISLRRKEVKKENLTDRMDVSNLKLLESCLNIFNELDLIETRKNVVNLQAVEKGKLDLQESVRYNENIKIINQFNSFARNAFADNVFSLIQMLKSRR